MDHQHHRYVQLDMPDDFTPEDLDRTFQRVYATAEDRSLVLIFRTSQIISCSAKKLSRLIPIIHKYKSLSDRKVVESHVVVRNKLLYRLLKCFLKLRLVKPARPVRIHRDERFLETIGARRNLAEAFERCDVTTPPSIIIHHPPRQKGANQPTTLS